MLFPENYNYYNSVLLYKINITLDKYSNKIKTIKMNPQTLFDFFISSFCHMCVFSANSGVEKGSTLVPIIN